MKKKIYILLIIFGCIIIDQLTKFIITHTLTLNSSVTLINNLLHFTYIKNFGAAFGIFTNMTYFIVILTILIFILLTKEIKKYLNNNLVLISYSVLIGGLFGNLIDRVFLGYVRDFIDVNLFNFPVFNFSDICIVIGTILLLIACFKLEGTNEKNSNK